MLSTVLLLLLMAMFQETNGQTSENCIDLKQLTETPCCEQPKPLRCAYLSPRDTKNYPECRCLVPNELKLSSKLCHEFGGYTEEIVKSTIPCAAHFDEECKPTNATPSVGCWLDYPPQPEGLHMFNNTYCNFEKFFDGNLSWPSEKIYDQFFNCWLYRCGDRLVIPEETKAKSDKVQWCSPPVLPEDQRGPKFCPLYLHDADDIYQAVPFSPKLSMEEIRTKRRSKGCVLPPICDENKKVNKKTHMLPWVDGKANENYCEVLCPKIGPNNGALSQDPEIAEFLGPIKNGCRMRPTCGDEKTLNRFQVPAFRNNCRPWCLPDSKFYLLRDTSNSNCNAFPLCEMRNGHHLAFPHKRFSPKNPYGERWICIIPTKCTETQNAETHYCIDPFDGDDGGGNGRKEAGLSLMILFIPVGVMVLFLLVGAVVVAIFYFLDKREAERKEREKREKEEEEEEKAAKLEEEAKAEQFTWDVYTTGYTYTEETPSQLEREVGDATSAKIRVVDGRTSAFENQKPGKEARKSSGKSGKDGKKQNSKKSIGPGATPVVPSNSTMQTDKKKKDAV